MCNDLRKFSLVMKDGISPKVFSLLSGMLFIISKYTFSYMTKMDFDKSDLVGFLSIGVFFLIVFAYKKISNISPQKEKLKEMLALIVVVYALIFFLIYTYGEFQKHITDLKGGANYLKTILVIIFLFEVPFMIKIYFEVVEEEILESASKNLTPEDKVSVHRVYSMYFIPLVIVLGVVLGIFFGKFSL